MKHVVLVSGARTAIGGFLGSLSSVGQIQLSALAIREAVRRAGIEDNVIDEVVVGNVGQIADSGFLARAAMLEAGLPEQVLAYAVNRQCVSGLQAIVNGAMSIQTGNAEVVVACGVENMSQLPYYVKNARSGIRMGHQVLEDGLTDILTWPLGPYHNGVTAEAVAEEYHVTRQDQDAFACLSQSRAVAAIDSGYFRDQIFPVEVRQKKQTILFDTDEHPRRGVTMESLAKLKPAFQKDGTVTAANSSGINDGAAAVVLMSEEKAKELGIQPWMELVDFAVAGNSPKLMGFAPAYSTEKLLQRQGLIMDQIDLVELNEAFASQSVAVIRALKMNPDKVNICGGAIALGHPVGASGCILPVKLMYDMKRTGAGLGIVTMCAGGGQGMSVLFRNRL